MNETERVIAVCAVIILAGLAAMVVLAPMARRNLERQDKYRQTVCATVSGRFDDNARGSPLCVAEDGRVYLYEQVRKTVEGKR